MPDPEIARRCPSCGVSIRIRADFCPQCGKPVKPKSDAVSKAEDAAVLIPDPGTTELSADTSKSTPDKSTTKSEKAVALPAALSSPSSAPRKQPKQATVSMVHHPGPSPRKVIGEDGLNRVDKFRQISSAMIDEAAYDPSLRFLLVAAVLFVLFLFLLLLSELIT